MEGSSGRVEIQKGLDIGEVIAQVAITTGFANVVWIEASAVVRRGLEGIAIIISRYACIIIELAGLC